MFTKANDHALLNLWHTRTWPLTRRCVKEYDTRSDSELCSLARLPSLSYRRPSMVSIPPPTFFKLTHTGKFPTLTLQQKFKTLLALADINNL
ncbi:hypothetical protein FQA47_020943 [Oryzias melastigma]|uniref:Uncharacterized protein n=1 Tax=Oryzias melastigma TaxID=30732 RepID=A0A834CGR5_ORYME|nr:hypothetical protein FQA47_020943 [Oryzias melastigma]